MCDWSDGSRYTGLYILVFKHWFLYGFEQQFTRPKKDNTPTLNLLSQAYLAGSFLGVRPSYKAAKTSDESPRAQISLLCSRLSLTLQQKRQLHKLPQAKLFEINFSYPETFQFFSHSLISIVCRSNRSKKIRKRYLLVNKR